VVSSAAGIGKTALAGHWAHRNRDAFTDGQLYIDLRGFDPSARPVPSADAIRAFLGALAVPPQRIPSGLTEQIGLFRTLTTGKQILVVIGNARDADQVRPLLPGARTRAVITSRNPMVGLVATEVALPIALDILSLEEAHELLLRRLGYERVEGQGEAVNDIISRRCTRLPLALALVAARAASYPRCALGEQGMPGTGLGARFAHPDEPQGRSHGSSPSAAACPVRHRLRRPPVWAAAGLLGLRPGAGLGRGVCVIATLDGTKFLDVACLAEQTGHPVRSQYKQPDEPDVLPPADAFVVAPATSNTINKSAQGISDTLALGLLNEATGKGLPIAAAPWPNVDLVRHPAFQRSIADLRDWGVRVILDLARLPGAGDPSFAVFPWGRAAHRTGRPEPCRRKNIMCRPGKDSRICRAPASSTLKVRRRRGG
jgi:hypothetical protein